MGSMSRSRTRPPRAEALALPTATGAATPLRWAIAWPHAVAAATTGALIGATFLNFHLHLLAWIAFTPLLWALSRARDRRETIVIAAIAGMVTNCIGFYWLIYTIRVFGGFPYAIAVLVFVCLAAVSSLQFVLFGMAFKRTGWGPLGLAPAMLWTSVEFLFPNLFPWRMAHTQNLVIPLIQIGDLTGPFGLSLVVVWASAAIAQLAKSGWRRIVPLATVGALIASLYAYGMARIASVETTMQAVPPVSIALVQGNVGIKEKKSQAYFEINVERYRQLTASLQDRIALAIWPETVVQEWLPTETMSLADRDHPFPGLTTHLIYGGLAYHQTGPHEADEYNSAFLIDRFGALLNRYDKQILMPFGEYIPFASLFPAIKRLSPQTGGFTPGRETHTFTVPRVGQIGPLICFEDLVTAIPRAMTQAGAEILVAMANDAWYGESAAPYDHQAIALWRAIENRRYLLRVNNSGVTGVIDPLGRVVGELPIFTADALVASVHPLKIMSVFTRIGHVFGWGLVGATVLLVMRAKRPVAG